MWLVRKVVKAARTESDLEGDRLQGALAQELQAAKARAAGSQRRPALAAVAPPVEAPVEPLSGADVREATAEHLPLVAALVAERETQLRAQFPGAAGRRLEVLWVRSNATHAVWCERRHAGNPSARPRDVICVALIERGKVTERWNFG